MQPLAVTPAMPSTDVSPPTTRLPGSSIHSSAGIHAGDPRERGEQQHLAAQPGAPPHFERAIGVHRASEMERRAVQRESRHQRATVNAATPRRVAAPNNCSSQIVTNAPTDSCVSTVIITSDQCACAGVTCVTPTGRASGGSAGQGDPRRREAAVGDRQPVAADARRHRGAPLVDLDDLDLDRAFRARADAGRRLAELEASMAHVALADDAALGVVLRHAVRAVPRAVLAADARVGAVAHDAGGRILGVGVDRAAAETGRVDAVIAAHREIGAHARSDTSRLRSRRRGAS